MKLKFIFVPFIISFLLFNCSKEKINEHTITIDSNGGKIVQNEKFLSEDKIQLKVKEDVSWGTISKNISAELDNIHHLKCWSFSKEKDDIVKENYRFTEDTTIYARYDINEEYNAVFNLNGGSYYGKTKDIITTNFKGTYFKDLSFPYDETAPVKKGFVFEGWSLSKEEYIKPDDNWKLEENNFTFYAIFKKDESMVKITFDYNYDDKVFIEYIEKGTLLTPIEPGKRDSLIFDGWYSEKEFKNQSRDKLFDFNKVIDSDITIYAGWAYECAFISRGVEDRLYCFSHHARINESYKYIFSLKTLAIQDYQFINKNHCIKLGTFASNFFASLDYSNLYCNDELINIDEYYIIDDVLYFRRNFNKDDLIEITVTYTCFYPEDEEVEDAAMYLDYTEYIKVNNKAEETEHTEEIHSTVLDTLYRQNRYFEIDYNDFVKEVTDTNELSLGLVNKDTESTEGRECLSCEEVVVKGIKNEQEETLILDEDYVIENNIIKIQNTLPKKVLAKYDKLQIFYNFILNPTKAKTYFFAKFIIE